MKYLFILFPILVLASCRGNTRKEANNAPVSIYQIWQFNTPDTLLSHKTRSAAWIGNNQLDLTNKDTLKFSYGSIHNKPTAYPYKIQHDTIFIQNRPAYKILKLTYDELDLLVAFKKVSKDSTVIIYKAK